METIHERLRRLREIHNLNINQVARAIDVPVTTYREWENGRKILGEPYKQLAALYEVSVYELVTGEKPSPQVFEKIEQMIKTLGELKQTLERTY